MSKRVIISVTNDLSFDQRIHRVAQTLHEAGWEVLLVGRKHSGSREMEPRAYRTHRMRLLFEKGKLFYLAYNFRLFWFLLFRGFEMLNANDLDSLLANFLVSRLRRKKLVYDSHEYFTEVPELVGRPRTRAIWLRLERWIFPRLRYAYTVNDSIAEIYRKAYGVEVGVVRNVPFSPTDAEYSPERERLLIYQGALNMGRGIDLMISALSHLPESYRLKIVGGGDVEADLKATAIELGVANRVEFTGRVSPAALAGPEGITAQAMVGLSLEEDLGLNYRYALPNKLFDYIQNRVPVLVSDLPEMRRIVEEYGVGNVLKPDDRTPEGLARNIQFMCETPGTWKSYFEACESAASTLCWEKEKLSLLAIYDQVLV